MALYRVKDTNKTLVNDYLLSQKSLATHCQCCKVFLCLSTWTKLFYANYGLKLRNYANYGFKSPVKDGFTVEIEALNDFLSPVGTILYHPPLLEPSLRDLVSIFYNISTVKPSLLDFEPVIRISYYYCP